VTDIEIVRELLRRRGETCTDEEAREILRDALESWKRIESYCREWVCEECESGHPDR
jgi:hypothetical protein